MSRAPPCPLPSLRSESLSPIRRRSSSVRQPLADVSTNRMSVGSLNLDEPAAAYPAKRSYGSSSTQGPPLQRHCAGPSPGKPSMSSAHVQSIANAVAAAVASTMSMSTTTLNLPINPPTP